MRDYLKLGLALLTLWSICTLASSLRTVKFDLTAECAATLLATTFQGQYSRVQIYRDADQTILVTLRAPEYDFEIPVRRYTPVPSGGFDVTYYFEPKPGPIHVDSLPYFRHIESDSPGTTSAPPEIDFDDESDVILLWDEWARNFKLESEKVASYATAAAERLLVTDHMNPDELGYYLAIANSQMAAEILKRAIPTLTGSSVEEGCAKAREHLFAPKAYEGTRDLDDADESNLLMLRRSLVEMRNFRFEIEADHRAKELLSAVGCQ